MFWGNKFREYDRFTGIAWNKKKTRKNFFIGKVKKQFFVRKTH